MKIKLSSVFVDDQVKALTFITDILEFVKSEQIPLGEFDWHTENDTTDNSYIELVLEPNASHAAKDYQPALFKQGIFATTFVIDNLSQEVERLKTLNVEITTDPINTGSVGIAAFADTSGNPISLYQPSC